MEHIHQVILNNLVTKDIDNNIFDYIYPWGETLAYISRAIKAYYLCTIMVTPGQAVFGRYMLFNLASFIDRKVVTTAKQLQVDIDNARENSRQVTHEYAIGD